MRGRDWIQSLHRWEREWNEKMCSHISCPPHFLGFTQSAITFSRDHSSLGLILLLLLRRVCVWVHARDRLPIDRYSRIIINLCSSNFELWANSSSWSYSIEDYLAERLALNESLSLSRRSEFCGFRPILTICWQFLPESRIDRVLWSDSKEIQFEHCNQNSGKPKVRYF